MYRISKQYHYVLIIGVMLSITGCVSTQLNSLLITKAIKDGVDINRKLTYGDTLLTLAVKENDLEAIKCILEADGGINQKDADWNTPLSLVVKQNNHHLAELLLESGADPNTIVNFGTTPLFMADDIRMLKLLIKYGGNPTLIEDGTALLTSPDIFNSQLLKLYIKDGGSIKEVERAETSKLMRAAMLNNIDDAINILSTTEGENNINAKDAEGWTVLMLACKLGNKDFVKVLVDNRVDVNLGNEFNTTPMMLAAQEGQYGIVELLLKAGSDVNAKDRAKFNALWYIDSKFDDDYRKTVDLLLEHGANINSEDIKGNSLLVVHIVFPDYAKYLCENGANVNGKNYVGETALIVAVRLCDYDLVSLLLDKKASVNMTSRTNLTALDYGLFNIDHDSRVERKKIIEANLIVQLLRKHGAKTAKELKKLRTGKLGDN